LSLKIVIAVHIFGYAWWVVMTLHRTLSFIFIMGHSLHHHRLLIANVFSMFIVYFGNAVGWAVGQGEHRLRFLSVILAFC
jgi:hypothetical protein